MPGFAQRAAMLGRGGDNKQAGGVLGHLGGGDVVVPGNLIDREPGLLASVIKAFGKHGGDWRGHQASQGRVNPETGLREFQYEPDPDPDEDYLRWAEANGMTSGAQDQAGSGWNSPTGYMNDDTGASSLQGGYASNYSPNNTGGSMYGFNAGGGGSRPSADEDNALLAEIMGGRQANTGPMSRVASPQTPPNTASLFQATAEDMAGNQEPFQGSQGLGQQPGMGQGGQTSFFDRKLPPWATQHAWSAPGLSQAQNWPQQLTSMALMALPGMGARQAIAGGLGQINQRFPGVISPDGGWGESANYDDMQGAQFSGADGEASPGQLSQITQLASQLTPTAGTQAQTGFTRPAEMEMPKFSGLSSAMTPLQQRTSLASYGTQGTNGMARSPEAQSFFRNLLMRSLIGPDGQLQGLDQLQPVELQYLQDVMGIAQPQNTAGLLGSLQPPPPTAPMRR